MVVLDLGCGFGRSLERFGIGDTDQIVGIDINRERCRLASEAYPNRRILCARGEKLPLADSCVDQVVSNVAVPYMNIPTAFREIHRVLRPDGEVSVTLHNIGYTLSELKATRTFKGFVGRLAILTNGVLLHFTARVTRIPTCESFQTERAMRRVLKRAGFRNVSLSYRDGQMLLAAKK
jgi:ubiquinone/menaquinone biosynthesis C-methylase UbiE